MNRQKVALITGAARRVGAEIASTLHEAGMNVVLHYHASDEEATQLCLRLNEKRAHSAVMLKANLSDADQLGPLVKQAVDAWGHLDILVNNASRFYKTPLNQTSDEAWRDLLDSNARAPFFLSRLAAPHLKEQQGCIVNIADIHAERPLQDYSIYCISKAALVMATKVLAEELGPDIRVNAVSPGAVMWPEGDNTLTQQAQEKIMHKTLLKRHGSAKDIAKSVLFFVRDAEFVTGQILAVDGGRAG